MKITKKSLKAIIEELTSQVVKEQVFLQGESEAMNDIVDWMVNLHPHGVKKDDFYNFIYNTLIKKYGREAVMIAYDKLIKSKNRTGKLMLKKTADGREFVVWTKE